MNKCIFFGVLMINFLMMGQAETLIQSGEKEFNNENWKAATTNFRKALLTDANNPIALEYLGDIKFKQKEWSEAANYFKKVLYTDKQNARYHFKYAGALGMKAKSNKLKGIFLLDDIKKHLQIAADLDPSYIAPRMVMVKLYIELPKSFGGGLDKAKRYADQIAAIDNTKGVAAYKLLEEVR